MSWRASHPPGNASCTRTGRAQEQSWGEGQVMALIPSTLQPQSLLSNWRLLACMSPAAVSVGRTGAWHPTKLCSLPHGTGTVSSLISDPSPRGESRNQPSTSAPRALQSPTPNTTLVILLVGLLTSPRATLGHAQLCKSIVVVATAGDYVPLQSRGR